MQLRDLGPDSGLLYGLTLISYLTTFVVVNAFLDWRSRR